MNAAENPQHVGANNQLMSPDQLAAFKAEEAAAHGKWEAFGQPDFPSRTGGIAVEASAELSEAYTPQTRPEGWADDVNSVMHEAEPGFRATESGILVPTAREVDQQPGTKDGNITDRRRNTPESVEAEYQAKKAAEQAADEERKEALVQPLKGEEIASAAAALVAGIEIKIAANNNKIPKGMEAEGDRRALSRLSQMARGEALIAYDERQSDTELPLSERLDKMLARMEPDRLVDRKTGAIVFRNYKPSNYYVVSRAKQVLDTLTEDPKITREGLLDEDAPISEELVDAVSQPMIVEDVKSLPPQQIVQNLDRFEYLPTFHLDSDFAREVVARRDRQEAA